MKSRIYILIFFTAMLAPALSGFAQDSLPKPPFHPKKRATPLPLVPQFPGGKDSLASFIKNNTKYPAKAHKHNISGIIEVDFVVTKQGELTNVRVFKSLGHGCDEEALRVVKLMPHWKPGMMGRDPMEMDYHVNIPFGTETSK